MNVAKVLASKAKAAITIKPTDTIAVLCELLRDKRVGAAVVSNDGRKIEGVITERDVTFALAEHPGKLHLMPVSQIMTRSVITCKPEDNVGHVASMMLSRNVRHIPVEDNQQFVGMVSIRDVLRSRVDELNQQAAQLRSFVSQASAPPQDRE
jgi:CBS domain-containing protein